MRTHTFRTITRFGAVLSLLFAIGCTDSSAPASACAAGELTTKKAGTLALATGALTRAPWVVGESASRANDPRNGLGYDASVGYELARRLGFERSAVTWTGIGFFDSLRSGAKAFDVGINQASITDARRRDVDLSAPYWVERPVVVTLKGRPLARVSTWDQLRSIPLAVVTGTPSASMTGLDLVPVRNLDDARRAVTEQGVQGLVTDYNTGMKLDQTETELVHGQMVAVLPIPKGAGGFGLVLQKGSALTNCVDRALRSLRSDGTLERLEKRWLIDEPGLRDLR